MRKFGLILCLALTGCAQTPGKGTLAVIGPMPAAGIVAVDDATQTVMISTTVPDGAETLGVVEGLSCRNSAFDPAPTEEKANEQVRQKAAAMGATGVANLTYERGGTSFATNCWSTIKATGTAYRTVTQ